MNTVKNMLEFQMLVLENVYYDDALFRKELKKSKNWLDVSEIIFLKKWLFTRFHNVQKDVIREVLNDDEISG